MPNFLRALLLAVTFMAVATTGATAASNLFPAQNHSVLGFNFFGGCLLRFECSFIPLLRLSPVCPRRTKISPASNSEFIVKFSPRESLTLKVSPNKEGKTDKGTIVMPWISTISMTRELISCNTSVGVGNSSGSRLVQDSYTNRLGVFSHRSKYFYASKIQLDTRHKCTVHIKMLPKEFEDKAKSVSGGCDETIKTNLHFPIYSPISGELISNTSIMELEVMFSLPKQANSSLPIIFMILLALVLGLGLGCFFYHRASFVDSEADTEIDSQVDSEVDNEIDFQIEDSSDESSLSCTELIGNANSTDLVQIDELVVSKVEIGLGSRGTVVYEGSYGGRRVAVKRLMIDNDYKRAEKEYAHYISLGIHTNIITCFGLKSEGDYQYIILERCTCTLMDMIKPQLEDLSESMNRDRRSALMEFKNFVFCTNNYPSPQLVKILRDVAEGLAYLHKNGIFHRDLKPQNILLHKEKCWRAKISDMGISKRLAEGTFSLDSTPTGSGAEGWQAPEQIERSPNQNTATDMFSFGILVHYCMTGGEHPFIGENLLSSVNKNITNITTNYSKKLDNMPEVWLLLPSLLSGKQTSRFTAEDILRYPLFWDPEKRLCFLSDASDIVDEEDHKAPIPSALLLEIRNIPTHYTKQNGPTQALPWLPEIDSRFINSKKRTYKDTNTVELLRFMRNTVAHYISLPQALREEHPYPEGLDGYFLNKFPHFLLGVYWAMSKHCQGHISMAKYLK